VVKCGFIRDPKILDSLKHQTLASVRSNAALVDDLVTRAVTVKASVVGSDFKENFEREILNYGHTFGHAVESHSRYSLRHGECVAIGMAFMAHLQLSLGLISSDIHALHFEILSGIGLPTQYQGGDWLEMKAIMSRDKKARGHALRFVTITELGVTDRLTDVAQDVLIASYEKVCP
jgi:3-dehydroquinate synthase